jgi:hypothetical protein
MAHTYRVYPYLKDSDFDKWNKRLSRSSAVGEHQRNHRHKGVRQDNVLVTTDKVHDPYKKVIKEEARRRDRVQKKQLLRRWKEGKEE